MFNFLAPAGTQLGYGKVGINILKTALDKQLKVSYFPINRSYEDCINDTEKKYHKYIQDGALNAQTFDAKLPSIRLWHQFSLAEHIGSKRINFPIFELDQFNQLEKHHLSQSDQILVPSSWAKEIIQDQIGVIPNVVGLGVDKSIFYPMHNTNPNKCVFLNIGKWEVRKGHDILLSVFQNAFPAKKYPDVELWMSCNNPFSSDTQWKEMYIVDPRVKFIPRLQTQEELALLINRADYGIFLSRAEGWGLGMAEMMACGKKCLTTDYAAHKEFCDTDNSYLIDIKNVEIARDGIWFHGQGNWAHLGKNQLDQAVECLRHMYNIKEWSKFTDLIPSFTWERTLQEIENALRR